MTIREYLKRRALRLQIACIPVLMAALVGVVTRDWIVLAVLVGCVLGVIIFVLMRRTPCPRCSIPLGNAAIQWRSKRLLALRCPRCDVSFDEQMPPKQTEDR